MIEYDFIIVGSGPAGCACARALYEGAAAEVTILVLEEAPEQPAPPLCQTAAGSPSNVVDDRCYVPTAAEEHVFEGCLWAGRGRALGGGSAVNGRARALTLPASSLCLVWCNLGSSSKRHLPTLRPSLPCVL